ncbi:MAG: DUF4861 family protein [Tannerellaceae bacterium]
MNKSTIQQFLFLLMACLLLPSCQSGRGAARISISNPSDRDRTEEVIEIPWTVLAPKLAEISKDSLVITNADGLAVPYQWISGAEANTPTLLIPVSVQAHKTVVYNLSSGTPLCFEPKVYGRFVPERKDDFTWENNRVAFRAYGPALEATGEISNGIDLWVKKTEALVIDKWYAGDLSGTASYHEDHGEGMDFYKVGRTLGVGALAPFVKDSLWLGNNYTAYEVLDAGPLRFTVRLSYAPFLVDSQMVTETRIITLDAGSYLNRITEQFEMEADSMQVAAGIVLRPEAGSAIFHSTFEGYAAYAEPPVEGKGTLYTAVVSPSAFRETKTQGKHLLSINSYHKGQPYIYYAGGSWNQSGFATPDSWCNYVSSFARNLREPFVIK